MIILYMINITWNRQSENHDQQFVNNWYEKLNNFSVELMKDLVEFCQTTKSDVTEQIKTKEALIQNTSSQQKYNNISKAIKETKKHAYDS